MRSRAMNLSLDQRFAALDDAKAAFVSKVYSTLAGCLIIATGACAYTVQNFDAMAGFARVAMWIPLGMLFLAMFVPLRGTFGWGFLLVFVTLMGVGLGPAIYRITESQGGMNTVGMALGLTASIFGALTLYVKVSGKDFSYLGGFLTVATIGLLLTGLALMFFPGLNIHYWYACAGAIIFCGWILYDTSAVTRQYYQSNDVVGAVLGLFLDIINLFMFLLIILRGDD